MLPKQLTRLERSVGLYTLYKITDKFHVPSFDCPRTVVVVCVRGGRTGVPPESTGVMRERVMNVVEMCLNAKSVTWFTTE